MALRSGGYKRGLGIVVHHRIWQRSRYPPTSDIRQPGGMAILSGLLKVEDEEDSVILILKTNPVLIEDIGGKLMRIACQVVEKHNSYLKTICLHFIRPRS